MNLYSAALTAQRCQRNWDWQKPVDTVCAVGSNSYDKTITVYQWP